MCYLRLILFCCLKLIGLQTQLNSFCHAASELKLKIHINKSNIIVFWKGGYLMRDGFMMIRSWKLLTLISTLVFTSQLS